MTAEEARKIATSVTTTVNALELKNLEDYIAKAVNRGDLQTHYYESISQPVKGELRNRGFLIDEIYDPRDGLTITIKW
jgi:hypothetical protein